MTLSSILKNVKPLSVVGNAEVEITGVDIDSRKVGEGYPSQLCSMASLRRS